MLFPFRLLLTSFKWLLYVSFGIIIFLSIFFISLPNVASLRHHNPKETRFMELYLDELENQGEEAVLHHEWVKLSKISSQLVRAVIVSEDDLFFVHKGFDWKGIKEALKRNWRDKGYTRGGSTITQQLVKNLYLDPDKNVFRKIREAIITYQMELTLSKKRILEIYLNIVEWGPGVYGAEAASHYYFGKPASSLSAREAAYLAAILPNPKLFGTQAYSKRLNKKIVRILSRMGY